MKSELVQGTTLNWRVEVAEYPASSGWGLTLALNPVAGGSNLTVVSIADGDAHLMQTPADVTTTWSAGSYGWQLFAIRGAEQYALDQYRGQLRVVPNLLTAPAGTDTRSADMVALDAIIQRLSGAASNGVMSYVINGRELRYYSMDELRSFRADYESRVAKEQLKAALDAGRPNPRRVRVRMARA